MWWNLVTYILLWRKCFEPDSLTPVPADAFAYQMSLCSDRSKSTGLGPGHNMHASLSCSKPQTPHPDGAGPIPSVIFYPKKSQSSTTDRTSRKLKFHSTNLQEQLSKARKFLQPILYLGNQVIPTNQLFSDMRKALPCSTVASQTCLKWGGKNLPFLMRNVLHTGPWWFTICKTSVSFPMREQWLLQLTLLAVQPPTLASTYQEAIPVLALCTTSHRRLELPHNDPSLPPASPRKVCHVPDSMPGLY